MMIEGGNDEGSGASSGTPDDGKVIIGGRRTLSQRGAAGSEFDDDAEMRTIGCRASDPLEGHLDRRMLLLLLLVLDRLGDLDLLMQLRRR